MDKQQDEKKLNWWGKRKLWQKILIIFVVAFIVFWFATPSNSERGKDAAGNNITPKYSVERVKVIDLSSMDDKAIADWCKKAGLNCVQEPTYSDTVEKGRFISQSHAVNAEVVKGITVTYKRSLGKRPNMEQQNALAKAQIYSDNMHFSKKGIYKQLTSPYGEKFDAAAAQYAVDNLNADYNKNALEQAKAYRDNMKMSKKQVYNQLVSPYGGNFTASEAKYAIDHMD